MIKSMQIEKTPRGFIVGKFQDANGIECSIQESSAMRDDGDALLWLGCDEPNPQKFPGNGTGWHPYKLPENVSCTTRMHISQEQVKMLLPLLKHFAKHGTLPR